MKKIQPLLVAHWPMLLGIVVLIILIKPLKDLFGSVSDGSFSLTNDPNKIDFDQEVAKAIETLPVQENQLNFNKSYYASLANRMYEAMQDWQPFFVSRFSEQDFEELEALNVAELMQVIKAFGTKTKSTWFELNEQVTGSLIDWLMDELSGSELERMQHIFSKTGLW